MKKSSLTHSKILAAILLSLSLVISACTRSLSGAGVQPTQAVTSATEAVALPIVPVEPTEAVALPIIQAPPLQIPAGLVVEEHALQGSPGADPFSFSPADGSMAEILARHEQLRGESFPDNAFANEQFSDMRRVMVGDKEVIARQEYSPDYKEGWVTVLENGAEVYRIATGPASPVTSLRGLWTYADHWVLETALVNLNEANDPAVKFAAGQVSQDGVLLNDQFGYSEMFGFQTLGGKLFFFFEKDGLLGYAYDGQVVEAGYTAIPHYACCSESALNPRGAQNLIAFFAQRGETWYYVEILAAGA